MSRYSQLYIERGTRKADSPRARRRLAAWLDSLNYPFWGPIYHALMRELGTPSVSRDATPKMNKTRIDHFFKQSEVADFLDGLTIINEVLAQGLSNNFRASQ